MQKKWIVLTGTALGVLLLAVSAPAQWSTGGGNYSGDNSSTLFQTPTGSFDGSSPPVYYPYWHNYLDNMQREGGYQTITGNYGGAAPVTSYYPASPASEAASPQTTVQSGMYSSPSEYQQTYGQGAVQQAPYQAYQAPAASTQMAPTATQRQATSSKKKRRLNASQLSAGQSPQQQYGQQQYQAYQQPTYQQPYQQPAATQQYQGQDPYAQQQAAYQQQLAAYQQQMAAYQQQQAYQQQYQGVQPQAVGADGQVAMSQDPSVRDAQQKAYDRAVARQRAAELAAQQQAAVQELQQAQQMLETAQTKFREQEMRQKQIQEEYHKKAVGDAYESLRAAQQRYYDLMGVSGESGRGARQGQPAQAGVQQPAQYPQQAPMQARALQQPQMAPTQQFAQTVPAQQYGLPATAQPAQYPQYQYGSAGAPTAAPGAQTVMPSPSPPGQATPLHVQSQQQEEGGGLWGTLKEIFFPPANVVQNPRALMDKNRSRFED